MQVTHGLGLGGLEQVIINLCRTLDPERFEVAVLCVRHLGPFADEVRNLGVSVLALDRRTDAPDRGAFLKARRVMSEWRPDVVHTHNTEALITGGIGAVLSGVPTIVHTDHARVFPDKLRYMAAEWVMSHFVYRMVGVSRHTSENLAQYEKIPAHKIITIPNGLDPSRFGRGVDSAAKRAEIGLTDTDGPILGFGARITEQKGLSYLVRALPDIAKRFPRVRVLVAGEGEQEAEVRAEAASLGVEHHLRFLGLRLDMPELFTTFDAMVLPSLWEGLPIIILEAMAAGVPVIATSVGGVPDAIQDRVSGRLVEPRDSEALARAVIELIDSPADQRKYVHAARAAFEERYSARAMAAGYESLYLRNPSTSAVPRGKSNRLISS